MQKFWHNFPPASMFCCQCTPFPQDWMFFAINLKFFHVAKFLLHRNMSLVSATNMACSVVHMFAHMDKKYMDKKHVQLLTPHLATNMMYVTTLLATRQTCTLSRRHWCWELGNMSRVFSKFKFSQSRPN